MNRLDVVLQLLARGTITRDQAGKLLLLPPPPDAYPAGDGWYIRPTLDR